MQFITKIILKFLAIYYIPTIFAMKEKPKLPSLQECVECNCYSKEDIELTQLQKDFNNKHFQYNQIIFNQTIIIPQCLFKNEENPLQFCEFQGSIFTTMIDENQHSFITVIALKLPDSSHISSPPIEIIPTFALYPKQPLWNSCQLRLVVKNNTIELKRVDASACPAKIYGHTFLRLVDQIALFLQTNITLLDASTASFLTCVKTGHQTYYESQGYICEQRCDWIGPIGQHNLNQTLYMHMHEVFEGIQYQNDTRTVKEVLSSPDISRNMREIYRRKYLCGLMARPNWALIIQEVLGSKTKETYFFKKTDIDKLHGGSCKRDVESILQPRRLVLSTSV